MEWFADSGNLQMTESYCLTGKIFKPMQSLGKYEFIFLLFFG